MTQRSTLEIQAKLCPLQILPHMMAATRFPHGSPQAGENLRSPWGEGGCGRARRRGLWDLIEKRQNQATGTTLAHWRAHASHTTPQVTAPSTPPVRQNWLSTEHREVYSVHQMLHRPTRTTCGHCFPEEGGNTECKVATSQGKRPRACCPSPHSTSCSLPGLSGLSPQIQSFPEGHQGWAGRERQLGQLES